MHIKGCSSLRHCTYVAAYSATTLGICLVAYFLLACWTLGVAVPSGLFVPCILIGAMYGHFFPTLLRSVAFVLRAMLTVFSIFSNALCIGSFNYAV